MQIELAFVGGDGKTVIRDWEAAEFVETEHGPFLSIDIPEGAEIVLLRGKAELS